MIDTEIRSLTSLKKESRAFRLLFDSGAQLRNKGSLNTCEIMLRKEKKIVTDTREIVQVLNDHYINIVERSCGGKTTSVAKQSYLRDDTKIIDHIIRHYEDHPSVIHIKKC